MSVCGWRGGAKENGQGSSVAGMMTGGANAGSRPALAAGSAVRMLEMVSFMIKHAHSKPLRVRDKP